MSEWQVSLIFQDSKSNKFWRARCIGNNLEVNFGRIGSQGQSQAKRYESPEDATRELEKQARKNTRKATWTATAARAKRRRHPLSPNRHPPPPPPRNARWF